ncbi:hypothetical protein BASA83_013829 [Batrachochytrium salamandrivorans]|nr:hypothetical protein BASA83_013829 [Batrachochytrium salamandrivorans]
MVWSEGDFPIIKQVWGVTLSFVSGFKLANYQLTVNYRSRIFSAVVMGKAYYGLELVGGNKSHLAPLQTTINKGIRLFTGARLSTAIGPFWLKLGLGHFSLAHWYHGAVGKIPALVWSRRTKQLYRNRYWLTPQVRPKTVKQRLVCIDGDSTNKWRLCIAPKVCHSTIIGHFWVLQGSQFRSIASTWHKI